ncbi:acyltransferase family protein [Actinomadura graeca]|uniref:Acyltransferase family protein n=1 Tax=Actinomadura graeca TaxID=2750812 RepID=A0ABX8QT88_9ACTN|nr:acyltransferase family protein [Actinomadura graeca]QXJ22041.1 acyltransferase family protein [Actinomadura graeca]
MTETLPQSRPPADEPPGRPAESAPPPRARDAYFDNAKFFTALLVVVGHVWAEFGDSDAAHAAYMVLYGFHMPVFVFISGYFSRGFMRSTEKFRSIFPTLIVPYVIFIVLYRVQLVVINDVDFRLSSLLRPHFLMWFLVAMVFWRLSAPLWGHLRHPVAVSLALALVAGTWAFTADSTLSRTAGLLPFFVLGLTIEPRHVHVLRRGWARWAGLGVLLAALPIAYVWERGTVVPKINRGFVWWTLGYEDMGYSTLEGMGGRVLATVLALVLGAAFLATIPRGRAWYTRMGTRTMYVYLLHGLVVKTFDYSGLLDRSVLHNPAGLVAVTLAAVALGVALATEPVRRATRWAVEPQARWLLKPSHPRT